jgi:hypothetical protein
MKYHIGIDISKRDFHVCFEEGDKIDKFGNEKKGIDDFLEKLKE